MKRGIIRGSLNARAHTQVIEDMEKYSSGKHDEPMEEQWWNWGWLLPSSAMTSQYALAKLNMNVLTDAIMYESEEGNIFSATKS